MPLLPPGHAVPLPEDDNAGGPPPIPGASELEPPPIPGTTKAKPASGAGIPPPPISTGIHTPPVGDEGDEPAEILTTSPVGDEGDEPAVIVQDTVPPPIPSGATSIPLPDDAAAAAAEVPPPVSKPHLQAVADPQPEPKPEQPTPPPAPQQEPAPPVKAPPNAMPAGTTAGSKVLQDMADEGFEGLEVSFGSFPIIRLQDQTFSTNEGEVLGNTFLCVVHASRTKWLLKAEDNNETDEFVYSFDKVTATNGKSIEEITAEWAAKGLTEPVWKKYLDVTAQMVDPQSKQLGNLAILSIPNNSVPRLTGYLTTLKLGQNRSPNQCVTQVYPGQKVTSSKKPFYPWAFKFYANAESFLEA